MIHTKFGVNWTNGVQEREGVLKIVYQKVKNGRIILCMAKIWDICFVQLESEEKKSFDCNLYGCGDISKNVKILIIAPPMVSVCTWVVGGIWDHPAKFGVSRTYGFGWPDTFRAEKD